MFRRFGVTKVVAGRFGSLVAARRSIRLAALNAIATMGGQSFELKYRPVIQLILTCEFYILYIDCFMLFSVIKQELERVSICKQC